MLARPRPLREAARVELERLVGTLGSGAANLLLARCASSHGPARPSPARARPWTAATARDVAGDQKSCRRPSS